MSGDRVFGAGPCGSVAIVTIGRRAGQGLAGMADGRSHMTTPKSFLGHLAEDDRAALAERWVVRRYKRKEMIIAHEEASRDVFFVLEGRALATVYSEGGRAVAYRDMGPGQIFGEFAAIDGQARSATRDGDGPDDRRPVARGGVPADRRCPPGLHLGAARAPVAADAAHDRARLRVQHAGRPQAADPRAAAPRRATASSGRAALRSRRRRPTSISPPASARTARRCRAR